MKRKYYMHRSGGKVFDYFGGVGTPFEVKAITGIIMKICGYKVTKVPAHYSEKQIMIRAALNGGAHRRSYKVEQIRKGEY